MRIIVDGDACPVKELVWRAAQRLGLPFLLVTNRPIAFGREPGVTAVVVPQGPDEADRWIAAEVAPADLVITADIPLAAAVVEKGALALGHRGEVFDEASIGDRLATWALHRELRESGLDLGGPKPFSNKDHAAFASAFEQLVARAKKRASRGGG